MYPTILSLPDGSDLIIEQTPTTLEIRLSLPKLNTHDDRPPAKEARMAEAKEDTG